MNVIQTVTGSIDAQAVTLADAHEHLWIHAPDGVSDQARLELDDYSAIAAELRDLRAAGGTLVVDCQPGGCGRDTRQLSRLSAETGVAITATTGFHRQIYYPPDYWLWSASAEQAAAYFIEELTIGTRESDGVNRATTIKIGYEGQIDGQTRVLMEGAAQAARESGALLLFHTEQGKNVEALIPFFEQHGVPPNRLYLCHVDKRPDFGLHRELAQAGVLLGYDTFIRPKYDPENGVWTLLRRMVDAALTHHVAIGLDMAFASMWRHYGGTPGLLALTEQIAPRLRAEAFPDDAIANLLGKNIARYLGWQIPVPSSIDQ